MLHFAVERAIWKKNYSKDLSYVYPRYGTQSLAKILQLSRAVRSFKGRLKVQHLDILFSGADVVVNSQLTKKVAQQWSAQNPGKVFEYEFPASLNINHDCIDPNSYSSKKELGYPVILKILNYAK
ncbi:MAG: hypothetical protein NT164_05340 [Verrucomicrobiae bacterium]|nr:hypothetical protein [Verrucomicrobiae bacterium]